MASSRFQLISKKFVKPSVSTPPSLRNYKLSLIDQLVSDVYMPMAFFYPNQHHHEHPENNSQISSLLEESLSKTLASYYPFSGRLTNNIYVDCNDMGATFLEARIRCPMSEILKGTNINSQDIIFPSGLPWSSRRDQPSLMVTQLSHFDCGGKALSMCMSHKLGDGHTLCDFINDWATMARCQSSDENPSPQYIGASTFPPIDDPPNEPVVGLKQEQHLITRCYSFDSDKLNQLKAKAATEIGVQKPTRIEVVSAFLYKCAMDASKVYSGSFKPSTFGLMMNLRPLIGLPATQNFVGNFVSPCFLSTTDERQLEFSRLVHEIRRIKVQKCEKYKKIKRNDDDLNSATFEDVEQSKVFYGKDDVQTYGCSSLCRFPTYDIDFGWGRPTKVNLAASIHENVFHLMDNHVDGRLEASVTLEEKFMSVFQNDRELLAFASPTTSF